MDDHRAIENLLYRYAECLDDGDLEAVAALFHKGQIVSSAMPGAAVGEAGVLAMYQASTRLYPETGTPCTQHVVSNPIIELADSGLTAIGRSRFTVMQAVPGMALQPIITGRYRDAFGKDNGEWFFTEREMIPELLGDLSQHLLFSENKLQS
ncbi:MAG: nuclear transport factor 2 family protein [Pseudomonadota bacterium]